MTHWLVDNSGLYYFVQNNCHGRYSTILAISLKNKPGEIETSAIVLI